MSPWSSDVLAHGWLTYCTCDPYQVISKHVDINNKQAYLNSTQDVGLDLTFFSRSPFHRNKLKIIKGQDYLVPRQTTSVNFAILWAHIHNPY